ncbi:hypothetical protein Pla175_49100 [Pirellulimonas nuda]|uniref:Recombinase A n=1 Tax=Pirellulimonas nuda TaxID=2528009 RepID=A0A518DJ18_9BACT|nr:hypothetical protein [Pirellulimonas nuda]QDU91481.1 hypothetical protein Pla175_49100 [Pirellulimonas nuda]
MADSNAGAAPEREELMRRLRGRVQQMESASRPAGAAISTGAAGLDRLLAGPGAPAGMAPGTLIDWVASPRSNPTPTADGLRPVAARRWTHHPDTRRRGGARRLAATGGGGACLPALWCAWRGCGRGGELVVIDPRGAFYPPAAAAWGVDLRRLLLVRPSGPRDLFWSLLAALRSPAVGAVWAECDRIPTHTFRALCLAAEEGGTLGMLVRPASALDAPTWADAQLRVSHAPSSSASIAPNSCRPTVGADHAHHSVRAHQAERPRQADRTDLRSAAIAGVREGLDRCLTLTLTRRRGGAAGGAVTLSFDPDAGALREYPTSQPPSQHPACPLAPSA